MKRVALIILLFLCSACFQTHEGELPLVAIQIQDRNGLTETVSTPERLEEYEKMDFFASKPFSKVLRVYKKEGKNLAKITTYHPNGMVWQYLEIEEMRAFGPFREWYPNGTQKIEAFVIGGTADVSAGSQNDWLFDGESSVWDEEGQLRAKIFYQKGSMEGKSLYFYSNGHLWKETFYKNDLLEGPWVEYYPEGSVKEKKEFLRGEMHGLSLGFFPDGASSFIEEYKGGLLMKGAYYNSDGKLISEVEDGWGFQVAQSRDLMQFFEVQAGKREGVVKSFSSKGELLSSYKQKEGKKNGEEIVYFSMAELEDPSQGPSIKLTLNWSHDKIHGSVKTWYNNGQLQSQKEYCHNILSGPACAWYKTGSLMYIEEYEEGKLMKGLYYKNYQKNPISQIESGKGIATLFDEEGVFLKKVRYDQGKPTQ